MGKFDAAVDGLRGLHRVAKPFDDFGKGPISSHVMEDQGWLATASGFWTPCGMVGSWTFGKYHKMIHNGERRWEGLASCILADQLYSSFPFKLRQRAYRGQGRERRFIG